MKLVLVGRAGARACDWSGYALLRDNVQHFIEGGEPSERFIALHGIETAVDGGSCVVDAARLRGEVLRAWYALCRKPLEQAAISLRTRTILKGSSESPTSRGTVDAAQTGWALPSIGNDPEAAAMSAQHFVASVLALTESAVDGEALEVRRHGCPPRYARRPPRGGGAARPHRLRLPLAWKAVGLAALATLVAACSAGWPPPPKAPVNGELDRHPSKVERSVEAGERERIVAPPPAYGNKVVQAEACRTAPASTPSYVSEGSGREQRC